MSKSPILKWIKEAASSTIFSRGKGYLDAVSKLKFDEDEQTWTAIVCGTEKYEVEIEDMGDGDFDGNCDCPYDQDYICKHIVAVALTIAAQENEVATKPKKTNAPKTAATVPGISPELFYLKIVQATSPATQSSFFTKAFTDNRDLRNQFLEYARAELSKLNDFAELLPFENLPTIDIEELSKEIADAIAELELDEQTFYDNYRPKRNSYEYREQWEEHADWVTEELESAVGVYVKQIEQFIKSGNVAAAVSICVAIYKAVEQLPPDPDDIEDILGQGISEVVIEIFDPTHVGIVKHLWQAGLSQEAKAHLLELIVDHVSQDHFDNFEKTFLVLVTEPSTAEKVLELLKNKSIVNENTAFLALQCAKIAQNKTEWISLAHQLYMVNYAVSIQLLEHYLAEKNLDAFHRIAKNTIEKHDFRDTTMDLIKNKLVFDIDPEFFLKVWEHHASVKGDMKSYQLLSTKWTPSQKEQFISAQINKSNFYASILNHEERFPQLLEYIESEIMDRWGNNYSLLSISGKKFPEETYIIFKKRFYLDENSMVMTRDGYASFCGKLNYLDHIDIPQSEKQMQVDRLRSIYVSRPAFLDELKKVAKKMNLK